MKRLFDKHERALGSTLALFDKHVKNAFLEVTLNHPRTKTFMNIDSYTQRRCLRNLFLKVCGTYDCTHTHVFEFCKDGQIHLHGFIHIHTEGLVVGAIQDIAKVFLRSFRQFNHKDYFNAEWLRFRSPAICIQYRENEAEQLSWIAYMNKHQGELPQVAKAKALPVEKQIDLRPEPCKVIGNTILFEWSSEEAP